ncbi:MAG: hypothetical protein DI585_04470 [Pseudomonas fluorescens]|nr:MAG: hypothetical protein DI585_04470 [Pseudomonas fluorescens]
MNKSIFLGLAAAALMVAFADPAFAQATGSAGGAASGAGSAATATLIGVITGNIGLLIGLGVTLLGLWTWIIGQKTGAGLTMIVGGVLITMAPGLFNGVRSMATGVMENFGGTPYSVQNTVQ